MLKYRIVSLILAILTVVGSLVFVSAADVTESDFTAEELDSSSYDLQKYTTPFWEGNIVYNECVMPIADSDGYLRPFSLMYEATKIISVKNYTLDVTYTEGIDYRLTNDGKLQIVQSGAITTYRYEDLHPTAKSGTVEDVNHYPHADDEDFEYWNEGSDISLMNVVVTYIHNDTWDMPKQETEASRLPGTMSKLMHREPLKIVVAGDSVSTGALSSKFLGISPFADAYPEMAAAALEKKYGSDITLVNSAIGGTMSDYTTEKLDSTIVNYSPDLVVICFGMNDSSCDRVGISGERFRKNISGHIEYIQKKLPNAEMLLVSSLYGNIYTFPAERYEEHAAILHEVAKKYSGVAVADPQAIEKALLEKKAYASFMADNMVHPNDYGMRLIAQTILSALDVQDLTAYKELLLSDISVYADPDSRDEAKKAEMLEYLSKLEKNILQLSDVWEMTALMDEAYEEIDFIIGKCADDEHVFTSYTVAPTCKAEGYTHSTCTVCGYEYDHSVKAALGGEHAMDSGRVTASPTYKQAGQKTYTCALCGYEEYETVPILSNAPEISGQGMVHIPQSFCYCAGVDMYSGGVGILEVDVCPIDISSDIGTPYFGLWISNYSIAVSYNFREQRVEIVTNTNLPYGGNPSVIASAKYKWTPDSGEYKYNWKKYAVKLNEKTHTVEVYIDGELILKSTDSRYSAPSVALFYSIGEYYIDNIVIGGSDYDPKTGSGSVKYKWDLDTEANVLSAKNTWSFSYSDPEFVQATKENVTTAHHIHSHIGTYLNTVNPTCNGYGYKEYECDICGKVVRLDYRDPTNEYGHSLTNRRVVTSPTDFSPGQCKYDCRYCYTTFTQIIPVSSGDEKQIIGDVNDDGRVDYADALLIQRKLCCMETEINIANADVNGDGVVDMHDVQLIRRYDAGWNVTFVSEDE